MDFGSAIIAAPAANWCGEWGRGAAGSSDYGGWQLHAATQDSLTLEIRVFQFVSALFAALSSFRHSGLSSLGAQMPMRWQDRHDSFSCS